MINKIINLQNELKRKIGEDKIIVGLPKNAKPKKFNKSEFIKAAKKVESIFNEDNSSFAFAN